MKRRTFLFQHDTLRNRILLSHIPALALDDELEFIGLEKRIIPQLQ
jgi:hypothetical protein